jgi:heptosyltransferase-2
MVTTDSGPRHFAAAFRVPTVAMFGPIHPKWSVNYNARETELFLGLPCSPCNQHQCPLVHHRCMRDMSVEMVFKAVNHRLADFSVPIDQSQRSTFPATTEHHPRSGERSHIQMTAETGLIRLP